MPINESAVRKILGGYQAVITHSHVVYTSGKHGSAYINKDAVYPHTMETSALCRMIAREFVEDDIDVVVAPAVGSIILSTWVAHHLTALTGYEVLGVYAEKETEPVEYPDGNGKKCYIETGNFVIKRGYDKLLVGKRVLVVEDIVNTGGSVKKTIAAVNECDGTVVGVGALCNRGDIGAEDLEVSKFVPLLEVTLDAWNEADCPLCKRRIPINTSVGKGLDFVRKHEIL